MAENETITAEVMEIDGPRPVAKIDSGEELAFFVGDAVDQINVDDELELNLVGRSSSAVIINLLPKDKQQAS